MDAAARRHGMTTGLRALSSRPGRLAPDLGDCLVRREEGRPWLLAIMEPLATKAPSPARATPHCCYIRTVIFYHRPHISVPARPARWRDGTLHHGGRVFAEYDRVETRLGWDDVVAFEGERFVTGGGAVRWHHQRWWLHTSARRSADVVEMVRGAYAAGGVA